MIRRRHGKTPYELLHNKPLDLSYLYVFGALYYPTNDSENLSKLQPKADIGIFIGYAPTKKAFRIYNRRTKRITETIHVDFDELTAMAFEHSSSGAALHEMTPATISSGLVPNPHPVDHPAPEVVAPEVIAPVLADSTGSPSSTTVDKDAPSPSNSQTTPETEPPVIPNDVEEDVFLTVVEPKTYKDALTQACWIEAMQEELNYSKRLKNKARLVACCLPSREESILEESFARLRDLEAIRIFPRAAHMNSRNGFLDKDNPNHVSKLKKALMCLKTSSNAAIHAVARLEVCNFWVRDLLASRLKDRKALRYPVRKLNILLCLAVVLKSFG
ncbi:retrovirus-related pol polyprotein from transposon TNT 1-94 [Tanacetum coccineum]